MLTIFPEVLFRPTFCEHVFLLLYTIFVLRKGPNDIPRPPCPFSDFSGDDVSPDKPHGPAGFLEMPPVCTPTPQVHSFFFFAT